MKEPAVTVSEELKEVLSKCVPGQTKPLNVEVYMDNEGKVTLKPNGAYKEEPEKHEEKAKPKSRSKRPAPIEQAIKTAYS